MGDCYPARNGGMATFALRLGAMLHAEPESTHSRKVVFSDLAVDSNGVLNITAPTAIVFRKSLLFILDM